MGEASSAAKSVATVDSMITNSLTARVTVGNIILDYFGGSGKKKANPAPDCTLPERDSVVNYLSLHY